MTVKAQVETLQFEAQVDQVMHLVTHALYSNKEIFLRELISNAADAIDKLRFESLSDEAMLEKDSEFMIDISYDKKARTITIRDNGIGMSREEAIENLGKIAKSGTQEFLKKLTGDQAKDSQLIGQFGVGFYSSFVVARKVIVKTRRAGMQDNQGVVWTSEGKGSYSIENTEQAHHGTEIILYLKPEEDEFLNDWRLEHIITKYSDHVAVPIWMTLRNDEDKEERKVVNKATALWTESKDKITQEDYEGLYQHLTKDYQKPLAYAHHRVEGKLDYIMLLYLPTVASMDLWSREHQRGLKLYVQRVFIMDSAEQLLPQYLRFVRGIVDSNDLPLNVSRELLQTSKIVDSIRSNVIKKSLDLLEKLSDNEPDQYKIFWENFGPVLKEGVAEDFANKDRIAKLLQFTTTQTGSKEQTVKLADYVARMKPEQEKIYFLCAEDYAGALNSPHLEIFLEKNIEVLLLTDRVDEWFVAHLTEYDGKALQSVSRGDLQDKALDQSESKEKDSEKKDNAQSNPVLKRLSSLLDSRVKAVRATERLISSPACLVADEGDMSPHLQRIMQEAGQSVPSVKPILEVNLNHSLLKRLADVSEDDAFAQWGELLLDQAILSEGGKLDDPARFVQRMNALLLK